MGREPGSLRDSSNEENRLPWKAGGYFFRLKGKKMPTVDMVRTGQNINRLRKQTGLSTADLQAALGLSSPRAIFKWQRGDCLPTVDNLVVLAALFGVRIDDILAIDVAG